MFAVIKTAGKQYRVAADEVLKLAMKLGEPGEIVTFGEVLVVGGDNQLLGTPTVAGASVAGEVLEHTRGRKIITLKKRRRKNSKRKRGYRQDFTLVRITEILTDGKKPTIEARGKHVKKAAAPAEAVADGDDEAPAKKPAAKKPAAKKAPAKKAAKSED
jgi:large subunit ribosomal protein L21